MAIVSFNSVTKGMSGAIGNLVFRQVRGKTIITSKPDRQSKKELARQSEQQRLNRFRFKMASAWAKAQMLDADKKAYYVRKAKKLKLPNAYTAAVSDYMRKGEIKEIDTRHYNGKAGNVIRMKIQKKDFTVHAAQVRLLYADGNVIESAMAVKKEDDVFLYKATKTLDGNLPVTIEVIISDHSKNKIMKQTVVRL